MFAFNASSVSERFCHLELPSSFIIISGTLLRNKGELLKYTAKIVIVLETVKKSWYNNFTHIL